MWGESWGGGNKYCCKLNSEKVGIYLLSAVFGVYTLLDSLFLPVKHLINEGLQEMLQSLHFLNKLSVEEKPDIYFTSCPHDLYVQLKCPNAICNFDNKYNTINTINTNTT